ncbi:MAG: hypothetical protein IJQ73_07565 [Kiritimatiellae bacterium]|nr:hypothetical protein [Kiritimatiellia bacterium]
MAWFHRLREPSKGDRITADWARELVKAVRSMRLFAGPGIRLTETPDGTTVSVNAAGGGFSAPAKPTEHFGNAEDAESRTEWEQTEEVPAILDLDGETKYKILIDSRGNVIGWTSSDDGEEPETPSAPKSPPPCGNPLNETPDDHNPLDKRQPEGGGSGNAGEDDYNPLDYEGEGGFTPACSDEFS